jgi:hypothetical protein
MHLLVGEKWGYPNIQIDPNQSRSNQIKSNRPWFYPNQIKLKVRFDLIYLFASLHPTSRHSLVGDILEPPLRKLTSKPMTSHRKSNKKNVRERR